MQYISVNQETRLRIRKRGGGGVGGGVIWSGTLQEHTILKYIFSTR